MLTVLRSLEIDLGREEIREKRTQLELAMAAVHSVGDTKSEGKLNAKAVNWNAPIEDLGLSLSPRPLLQLRGPGNPVKPVNTHPTDRPLDANDHIVNFFEGRTVEVAVKAPKSAKDGAVTPAT